MPTNNSTPDYAGDVDAQQAWDMLASDAKAQLIDVRTAAEWTYVGLPDLTSVGRETRPIEWQTYPSGEVDPDFTRIAAEQMKLAGAANDTTVLLLCRSGARSKAAAIALTRAGFRKAYNIVGGFEGNLDGDGHRGNISGWKAAGLPWRQG